MMGRGISCRGRRGWGRGGRGKGELTGPSRPRRPRGGCRPGCTPGLYRDNVVLTIALSASLALEAAARKKRIREGYLQTPTLVFLHNFQPKLVGG